MKKDCSELLFVIICLLFVLVGIGAVMSILTDVGLADTGDGYDAWVICQPDSYVNVREAPRKTGMEAGRLDAGDRVRTDGKEKNGYLHIIDAGTEKGDGWVHTGFIVYDEPRRTTERMVIGGKARVACRKSVGGKRKAWAKPGSFVTVYWISDEWAVTNRGFIATRWLEVTAQ